MRRSLRLRDFDYRTNGAYFITICTYRRRRMLTGSVRAIAEAEFNELPARFIGLAIDCHMLQPDHLHAVLQMSGCPATLSSIVQAYKSLTTRRIKELRTIERVWQRGFHDRIIRNELELSAIREYVAYNEIVHAVRRDDVIL